MALQRHFNLPREFNDTPYEKIESTMHALGGGAVDYSPSTSYIASFLIIFGVVIAKLPSNDSLLLCVG